MTASRSRSLVDRAAPLGLGLLFLLALLVHRPWEYAPFSRTDFSEFLPLLTANEDFWSRLVYWLISDGAILCAWTDHSIIRPLAWDLTHDDW